MRLHVSLIKVLTILVITTAIGMGAITCGKKDAGEIRIGAILPLTGSAAVWGQNDKEGMDLAIEEINNDGGVIGKEIQLLYEDSEATPQKAVGSFHRLIKVEKVQAIIGDIASSPTLAIAPLAQENKIVLLSPGATAPKLSEAGPYFFRIWNSDADEGKATAEYAYEVLGYRKVAIIYINNDYGKGLKDVFENEFNVIGGKIDIIEVFDQNATDYKTQLNKIRARELDAVYLVGYPREIPLILRQAKEIGLKKQIIGSVAFQDPGIVELAKEAAEGVIYPYPIDPDLESSAVAHFIAAFQQKYGKEPGIGANAGYDAVKMIAKAIELSGEYTGEGVRKGLNRLEEYRGSSGIMTFDENGDVHKPIGFKTISKGKFVWYES